MTHDIFPVGVLQVLGAMSGRTAEEEAQELLKQEKLNETTKREKASSD